MTRIVSNGIVLGL